MKRNTGWDFYSLLLPWSRITLIDGTLSVRCSMLMRRRLDGVWQYRNLTAEEWADWQSAEAW